MRNFDKYLIHCEATVRQALIQLNELSSDILLLFITDNKNRLLGTLTDGDVRRGLISGKRLDDNILSMAKRTFYFVNHEKFDVQLIKRLRSQLKLLPVLDDNGYIVKIYDLTRRKTILPIDAVLMAGGKGERLRPLTNTTPKPMLLVGNKPIIEHNIDNLIYHGVDNFYITVNYLAEQITTYFGNGENKGINISCIKESKPLGTIGSVSLIKEFKNDTILVMNSDLFTNINYEDFYLDFIQQDADMSVASVPYNVNIPYAILNNQNGIISSFEEKPTYTYYANAGIYLIKRKLLSTIPIDECYNATDFIQTLIDKNCKVIKYPIVGYWVDIGKHEDFNKVQEFVKHLNS